MARPLGMKEKRAGRALSSLYFLCFFLCLYINFPFVLSFAFIFCLADRVTGDRGALS